MKLHPLLIVLFTLQSAILHAAPASQPSSPAGIWLGTLHAGAKELRLLVTLDWYADSGWRGTLNSLDQTAVENRLEEVIVHDKRVRFDLHRSAFFEGELSGDALTLAGVWKQGGATLTLTLQRQEKAPVLSRAQDPKPPFPYDVRDVTFENPAASASFAATLTTPSAGGPHPCVVLISGSGPQNRNEECFGHRPFWVLADHLTRNGIAVLRYDDRGVGGSTGDRSKATSVDYADDALAAVAFLKTQRDIDPARIGLIGHSEGGIVAPIAAAKSKDVAFIVLLAGPGIPGKELLLMQNRAILTAAGAPPAVVDLNVTLAQRMMEAVIAEPDDAKVIVQAGKILDEELARQPPLVRAVVEAQGAAEDRIRELVRPWMRFFLAHDPAAVLQQVNCPVLAIGGEKDVQVPPAENLAAIEKALRAGGNEQVTTVALPNLNHLFQTADTGAVDEYARIPQTFAPAALDAITQWVRKTCGM